MNSKGSIFRVRAEKGFYKTAFLLMLPIMLQNLISHALSLCDTMMVGALGEEYLASMTVANTPFYVLSIMLFGVQAGACVLTAQYHGKGDKGTICRVLGTGLYAGLLCSILFSGVIAIFPEQIMGLLTNNASLVPLAARYGRIIGIAHVLSCVSGIYFAIWRSMEKPQLGAYILGISALLNIFFNWVLIFGKLGMPALGIEGAAIATTLSRVFEIIAVIVHAKKNKTFRIDAKLLLHPGKSVLRDFFRYAMPVIISETFWSLGTTLYTVVMGYMQGSTAILAASTLASNVERIVAIAMSASANAGAVLIGKTIGERGKESAFRTAISMTKLSMLLGIINLFVLIGIRYTVAETILYPLMKLSPDAVWIANFMIVTLGCIAPFHAVNTMGIGGILRGGGDGKVGMYFDVLPTWLYALPAAAIAALVFESGVVWMYLLKTSGSLFKTFFVLWRIRSGKWAHDVTDKAAE